MAVNRKAFKELLSFFPHVDLPVTLTSETHHVFSKENKPLPQRLILEFFSKSKEGLGEFEEYIPCFRLPRADHFIGLVYWKADLMNYEYVLNTYDLTGEPVASQVIAGTKSNGESILNRVATFDPEGVVYIAEGIGKADVRHYNAAESKNYELEILPSGDILYMMNDQ